MKYLLDTCAISELVAKQPSEIVIDWIDNIEQESVYLSVITIGEICKGIEKLPESKRKINLQKWLNDELIIRFRGQILLVDTDVTHIPHLNCHRRVFTDIFFNVKNKKLL